MAESANGTRLDRDFGGIAAKACARGRIGKPRPACGSPGQRIVYAENETNYCARCQTGGKLLADRGLSRLLKDDWPRSLDELEDLIGEARRTGA